MLFGKACEPATEMNSSVPLYSQAHMGYVLKAEDLCAPVLRCIAKLQDGFVVVPCQSVCMFLRQELHTWVHTARPLSWEQFGVNHFHARISLDLLEAAPDPSTTRAVSIHSYRFSEIFSLLFSAETSSCLTPGECLS